MCSMISVCMIGLHTWSGFHALYVFLSGSPEIHLSSDPVSKEEHSKNKEISQSSSRLAESSLTISLYSLSFTPLLSQQNMSTAGTGGTFESLWWNGKGLSMSIQPRGNWQTTCLLLQSNGTAWVQGRAKQGRKSSRKMAWKIHQEGEIKGDKEKSNGFSLVSPLHLCLCRAFLFLLLKKQQHLKNTSQFRKISTAAAALCSQAKQLYWILSKWGGRIDLPSEGRSTLACHFKSC